jgi:hypothetical protein
LNSTFTLPKWFLSKICLLVISCVNLLIQYDRKNACCSIPKLAGNNMSLSPGIMI